MATEVTLPLEQPNDVEAEIVRWLVEDGQWAEAGEDLVEVESSKAVTTVTAVASGYVRRQAAVGDSVRVGAVLVRLHSSAEELAADPEDAPPPGRAGGPSAGPDLDVRFSAGGEQELARSGLPAELFRGRGLATARTVREVAAELAASAAASAEPASAVPPAPPAGAAAAAASVPVERYRLGPAKQTEIARLTSGSRALASAITVRFDSAALRASLHERPGTQPLVLAVLIQGLARLLREFPDLNARFTGDHEVERYTRVNVGVAVDLGHGLRVPVIRDADRLDPVEITAAYLGAMAAYHDRRLSGADLSGGTVTVSDLSGDGVYQFQPLLNQDQTLAVGVGADAGVPGHPMTVTAVFDHRVSTGRIVAEFLSRLKAHLLAEDAR